MPNNMSSEALLSQMRNGNKLSIREQIHLTAKLSIPAIMAQLSTIMMQYIDASMVGRLGTNDSAAIGLVSTTTWLFGGIVLAATVGYTIQVAHRIGARDDAKARNIMMQAIFVTFIFACLLALIAVIIAQQLPYWLGGSSSIADKASSYFLIYCAFIPAMQINYLAGSLLQSSGNMRTPAILNVLMCLLDIIFNYLFIFPTSHFKVMGLTLTLPGLNMGVSGAALGTVVAETLIAVIMLSFLLTKSEHLHLRNHEKWHFEKRYLYKALKLSLPVAFEEIVMCLALIMSTVIVAPLGTVAIAANSFAVTAESLCYMPGYGIGAAATTLIGQSFGANRKDLSFRLAYLTTAIGMLFMSLTGILLYIFAPQMMALLTPVKAIQDLGVTVLRIEAFAEPLYAASIVISGALRGAGDTLIPSIMNFASIWLVRIPLAAILAPVMGLKGVWIAMCSELMCRGILFIIRLFRRGWLKKDKK